MSLCCLKAPVIFSHLPEALQPPLVALSLPRPDVGDERSRVLAVEDSKCETDEVETLYLVDGIVSQVDVPVVRVPCLVRVGLCSKPDGH